MGHAVVERGESYSPHAAGCDRALAHACGRERGAKYPLRCCRRNSDSDLNELHRGEVFAVAPIDRDRRRRRRRRRVYISTFSSPFQ